MSQRVFRKYRPYLVGEGKTEDMTVEEYREYREYRQNEANIMSRIRGMRLLEYIETTRDKQLLEKMDLILDQLQNCDIDRRHFCYGDWISENIIIDGHKNIWLIDFDLSSLSSEPAIVEDDIKRRKLMTSWMYKLDVTYYLSER